MTTITTNNSSSVMNISELMNYTLNDLIEPMFCELDKENQENTYEDINYFTNLSNDLTEPMFCELDKEDQENTHENINYFTKFLNDSTGSFYREVTQENIHADHTYCCLKPFQSPTKQTTTEPNLHTLSAKVKKIKIEIPDEWIVPSESKIVMVNSINKIFQEKKLSLKKIQRRLARILRIDRQEIKNIYSAVSKKEPSANESSTIETYQSKEA